MYNPDWAGIEFSLHAGSEERFQLFQSWLSSVQELMIGGLDAREVDESYSGRHLASISAGERWQLNYEVIAVNAQTVHFTVFIYVKDNAVAAEMRPGRRPS